MEPSAVAAIVAGLVFLAWSVWLYGAGRKVGAAPIGELQLRLEVTEGRLRATREALALEIKAGKDQHEALAKAWERDKRLDAARAAVDPDRQLQLLLQEFPPAREGAGDPAGEPEGQAGQGHDLEVDS